MNREKEDQLPMMQVGFIDSICLPIYEVSFGIFDCGKKNARNESIQSLTTERFLRSYILWRELI